LDRDPVVSQALHGRQVSLLLEKLSSPATSDWLRDPTTASSLEIVCPENESMPRVEESIPANLVDEAEAARAWFARDRGGDFKLTGIVDPDQVRERDSTTHARQLQLILCGTRDGQDVCLRERFEVKPASDGFDVTLLEDPAPAIGSPAPLLDPPLGVRADWLTRILTQHSFVVLVFYRGFW
jgi:hypothetical protein